MICNNWQESTSGTPVTMRVDAKGFYLYWIDQNNELDMLDIATIRDVRTGQYAKKPRVSFILPKKKNFLNSCRINLTLSFNVNELMTMEM